MHKSIIIGGAKIKAALVERKPNNLASQLLCIATFGCILKLKCKKKKIYIYIYIYILFDLLSVLFLSLSSLLSFFLTSLFLSSTALISHSIEPSLSSLRGVLWCHLGFIEITSVG